jgi:hypothetical protein
MALQKLKHRQIRRLEPAFPNHAFQAGLKFPIGTCVTGAPAPCLAPRARRHHEPRARSQRRPDHDRIPQSCRRLCDDRDRGRPPGHGGLKRPPEPLRTLSKTPPFTPRLATRRRSPPPPVFVWGAAAPSWSETPRAATAMPRETRVNVNHRFHFR